MSKSAPAMSKTQIDQFSNSELWVLIKDLTQMRNRIRENKTNDNDINNLAILKALVSMYEKLKDKPVTSIQDVICAKTLPQANSFASASITNNNSASSYPQTNVSPHQTTNHTQAQTPSNYSSAPEPESKNIQVYNSDSESDDDENPSHDKVNYENLLNQTRVHFIKIKKNQDIVYHQEEPTDEENDDDTDSSSDSDSDSETNTAANTNQNTADDDKTIWGDTIPTENVQTADSTNKAIDPEPEEIQFSTRLENCLTRMLANPDYNKDLYLEEYMRKIDRKDSYVDIITSA